MPEDPKASANQPEPSSAEPISAEPISAESAEKKVDEEEIGDFITRHVLEKDSVFFEG